MKDFKEKYLRPGRKPTDQFIIAALLTFLLMLLSVVAIPIGMLAMGFFESVLGGNHDAVAFLREYFDFIGIWIVFIPVVMIIKFNRPMLNAIKYVSPRGKKNSDDAGNNLSESPDPAGGIKKNRAGNNIRGLLIGLALGFISNGFCILMSALMGDIHLEYSGFEIMPFLLFFVCVFIQSGAEEITDRWFLYQKIRRRYKAPWIAIFFNAFSFMAMHIPNPGISFMALLEIFVTGVLFSLFVYYYNGLWIAMAFHTAWNFTQSIFFGLPNSGVVSAYSVFKLDAASATNGIFYNVNFGVEGSIGSNIVNIALVILIILINRGKGEHTDVWAGSDSATG